MAERGGALRINADDFGLHPSVSEGIAHCARRSLIDSLSALPFAEGDRFHHDLLLELKAERPDLGFGPHLTLFDLPAASAALSGLYAGGPPSFPRFLRFYLAGRLRPE